MLQIEYRIITRPWGVECQYQAEIEDRDPIVGVMSLSSADIDPEPLITAQIEAQLAQATTQTEQQQPEPVPQTVTNPPQQPAVSIIDTAMIEGKERLKWVCIAYIKEHPSAAASDWLDTLTWPDAGIAQALIYTYAESAAKMGLVTLADDSIDSCWLALRYLANTMSDDELRSIL